MKRIGRVLGTLGILILACSATASWAALTASVDRDRVALGDTLQLTIAATNGEDLGDIDLRPLEADFEILRRSNSSKTSYINGQFSSSTELVLDITPLREGALSIPALRLGGLSTDALAVVAGPPPKGTAGDQSVLFEAEVDRSQVYVQGQVILTLRLQQGINLDDRNITQLNLDNAFVRPLEQNSFQRTVSGRTWLVHEVRYAIFPEQSGTLVIPTQTFSAREAAPRRSLFDLRGGGRQLRRNTEPLTIEVLPRPASYPSAEWLPAASLSIEETWSTPPERLKVGESATRTITIRGEGLQGAQLPPVMFPSTQGLKFYPDQPTISDSESATGLTGTRVDSVAVVPTQACKWQIPELRIPWWDTRSNELRYAVLPPRELDVAAANNPATDIAPTPPQPATPPTVVFDPAADSVIPLTGNDSSRIWQILCAITAAGWLLTLGYLVWSRRGTRPLPRPAAPKGDNQSEQKAFKELVAACASGNSRQARQAVIHWAAALKSVPEIASLAQVSAAFDDPALNSALEALNAALYSGAASSWQGAALADAAKRLRQMHRRTPASDKPALQLYPSPG